MTSIADAYRQEGRQEGRHLAKLETAHEMLLKGLDEVMVAEITKLSLTEVHNAALKIKSEKQTHH